MNTVSTTAQLCDAKAQSRQFQLEALRLKKRLNAIAISAQKVVQPDERKDKLFSDNKSFNDYMRRMIPALANPLTHRQWSYIVAEARSTCMKAINDDGHIPEDAIADNDYAVFVRQILSLYVNTFGLAQATTALYEWQKDLHANSEGGEKAGEICSRIMNPVQTQKRVRKESLTSICLRKNFDPPEISATINKAILHDVTKIKEKHAQTLTQEEKTKKEYDDARVVSMERIARRRGLNVKKLVREDFSELITYAISKMTDEQRRVLSTYLDPEFAGLHSEKKTFGSGTQAIRKVIGMGEHKLRCITKQIIQIFRETLKAEVTEKRIKCLLIKDPTVRSRMANGIYTLGYVNQETAMIPTTVQNFFSEYLGAEDIEYILDYVNKGNHVFPDVIARLEEPKETTNNV